MTVDDGEFGELADLQTEAMHGVEKAANGTSFLVAKSAAGGQPAGLLDTGLVADLVAKADADAPEAFVPDTGAVTVSGSAAAVADMMARVHSAAVRKSEPTIDPELDRVVKSTDGDYVAFVKAKYTAEDKRKLAAKGHAMRAEDGTIDYPIDDAEDLTKAIRAVGRGGADHDKIRKYVIGRARAMGKSDMIPENWASDGSLKQPVSKADGDAADPGSPAWEGQDAAAAHAAIEQILACLPPVKALAQREGAEVGNGHMEDLCDVADLQEVQDLLTCAAKKLAGFKVGEMLEAGQPVAKAQEAPPIPAAAAAPAPKENAVSETQTATQTGAENVAKAEDTAAAGTGTAQTQAEPQPITKAAALAALGFSEAQLLELGAQAVLKAAGSTGTQTSGAAPAPADTVPAPAQAAEDVSKAEANDLVTALNAVMAPVVKQLGELTTQVNDQKERVEKAMRKPDDRNSPAFNGATGQAQVADRTHDGSPIHSPEFQAIQKSLNELPEGEVRDSARAAVGVAAIKARFGSMR